MPTLAPTQPESALCRSVTDACYNGSTDCRACLDLLKDKSIPDVVGMLDNVDFGSTSCGNVLPSLLRPVFSHCTNITAAADPECFSVQ